MYEIILSCIYMKEFKSKFIKLTQILVKMPLFNKDSSSYKSLSRAQFKELPSRTVHLWKSRSMVSKGYIQCTCRISETENIDLHLLKASWSWQFKQLYRTPHHKHWSVVWIFERLHDCTTLFFWKKNNFMYKPCFSNLKAGNLRLNLHISKLEAFVLWDARIECQVTFEVLYFHFPEFQSLWKLHLVVSDISYSALSVPFYFCYMFCVNSKMACKRVF